MQQEEPTQQAASGEKQVSAQDVAARHLKQTKKIWDSTDQLTGGERRKAMKKPLPPGVREQQTTTQQE